MLTLTDLVPGVVPYHQECEPQVMRELPANTYVKGLTKKGSTAVIRVMSKRGYWGDPRIEVNGVKYYASAFYNQLQAIVPLPDQDVMSLFPLGKQVNLYAKDPKFGALQHTLGVVVGHTNRRVRVAMQFGKTPVERTYYPTYLY